MRIGIDFDNTIACYDDIFVRCAEKAAIISRSGLSTKAGVRELLLSQGRHQDWTRLQGAVYGEHTAEARPFPGAVDFIAQCSRAGAEVHIISHKTRFPVEGPRVDLPALAMHWLERNGCFEREVGLKPTRVHFTPTRAEKLAEIGRLNCEAFIDDLLEVLAEPNFPAGVLRILFDPNGLHGAEHRFRRITTWPEAAQILFSETGRS